MKLFTEQSIYIGSEYRGLKEGNGEEKTCFSLGRSAESCCCFLLLLFFLCLFVVVVVCV